jgi:carnitine-CoA ligase
MKVTSEKVSMHRYGYAVADMTVARLLADKAAQNADRLFCTFLHDGRRLSYRDVDRLSNRLANGLLNLGLGPGKSIAVMMDNCPEQMLMHFAIMKIGAVSVPLNTAARGRLLAYFLNQSDAIAVVAESRYLPHVADAVASVPAIGHVIVVATEGKVEAGTHGSANTIDYRVLEQSSDAPHLARARFSDLAMLIYTSGTTGPSKGNMAAQATVVQFGMTTAESHGYRHTDTIYLSLPISHANAYFALWGALIADASVALSRRFSVSRYWNEIAESGATLTNLLGSMVNMIWAQPPRPEDTAHRLRACMMVPVPPFARAFEERFATRVTSSYGQTDYSNLTVFTLLDPASKLGSAGRPRAGVEIRIVDENDLDVARGEAGEIIVRNNNFWATSLGYYKMPEATAQATRHLWWHTGDHGYLDSDGYLYFAGRKKDALRRRGENISAYEVESVIQEHPGVAEAAVYGVASQMSEDEVAVSIVRVPGHDFSEAMLIEYCIDNMAHYMVPRYVQFVADLPRTESQKVQKAELRRRAEADLGQLWDRERDALAPPG